MTKNLQLLILWTTVLISHFNVAQEFVFHCELADDNPMKYYDMFVEDAAKYGWDFSKETGSIIIENNWIYGNIRGFSAGRCETGYRIFLNPNFWYYRHYTGERLNLFRKYIIYHELGHDLLDLPHICRGEYLDDGFYFIYQDLMQGNTACPDNTPLLRSSAHQPWQSNEHLNRLIANMFNLIYVDQSVCNN